MTFELDLHGYTVVEAIDAFLSCYNERVGSGEFGSLIVIHGYGSSGEGGAIRNRFRRFLANHPDRLTFEPGEECWLRNPGATLVHPGKGLPSGEDALAAEILDYCSTPKTKSKIAGKFRIHGEAKVLAVLKRLERQKLLCLERKGSHTLYRAAP